MKRFGKRYCALGTFPFSFSHELYIFTSGTSKLSNSVSKVTTLKSTTYFSDSYALSVDAELSGIKETVSQDFEHLVFLQTAQD
jgi:hypothetical protein